MSGTAVRVRFMCGCADRADLISANSALTLTISLPDGLQELVKLVCENRRSKPDIAVNSLADISLE
jgi:hypothetical protein